MRRSLALCFLVLVALASNAFAGAEARLTGKITDAVTKQPIPNAVVTTEATSGKTLKMDTKAKKDGTYAIFLLDGTIKYKFTYKAEGYAPFEETAKLKLGEPNTRDIMLTPGNAQPAQGGTAVAIEAKADPSVTAFNEGAALANAGNDAEALKKFEESVTLKPDLVAGWSAIAKLQLRQKQYAKAIEAAEKAMSLDPDETSMNAVLYESYNASGNKAKAAEYRTKMPANPTMLFNDAAKAINAGKDSEAEPLLKNAIAADEKFANAYYELGMLYVRAGKNADARTNLQKYLDLEPNGKDAATAKEMLNYVK